MAGDGGHTRLPPFCALCALCALYALYALYALVARLESQGEPRKENRNGQFAARVMPILGLATMLTDGRRAGR